MKEALIDSFDSALEKYCKHLDRGYKITIFSYLSHRFTTSKSLQDFKNRLHRSANDEHALHTTIGHLLSKKSSFRNHSFSSYFIDELKERVPAIDWNNFTPHPVKLYTGLLYRGSFIPPEAAFIDGFQDLHPSPFIKDYLKFRNYQTGISSSKLFECAEFFALKKIWDTSQGFIYAINYRQDNGYDIVETAKARGTNLNITSRRREGLHKQEVNVKGFIPSDDIIGAWQLENKNWLWQPNPNYRPEDCQDNQQKVFSKAI